MGALQSSGTISLSDIRAEFVGGSSSISLQDLLKGSAGGNSIVRAKASNNAGTDLAPNVPSSGAISFSNFYGAERAFAYVYSSSQNNQSASSNVFGDDYAGNYKKRITVNNGVTLSTTGLLNTALDYPSNAGGELELINNGTINANGSKGVDNNSSLTITVTGNGTFTAGTRDDFVSALQSDGSVQINYIGGFGGASGSDIRHSDYGGSGFNSKLTRSGNTFNLSWTYNEVDYYNAGSGSVDITSIFPMSGSNYNYTTTSAQNNNNQVYAHGRDNRSVAVGREVVSGTMYYWFGSNNKVTSMEVANDRYIQYGHTQTTLTTGNSQRSSVIQSVNGTRREGNFNTSGFSGTDN
tara:strand:+ start:1218 stop:2273 length:1056 start_codon:yes stop_codon:yes gene_type:complete